MKKRIILTLTITFILACLFVLSASAVESSLSNAFGTAQTLEGIDLTGMSTDTTSRVVLMHTATDEATGEAKAYYTTYPSQYIVTSAANFTVSFDKINAASNGITYSTASVIRIEVPTTVTNEYTTALNNSKGAKNLIEVYFPANSNVKKLNWGAFESLSKLEKVNIPASVTAIGNNCFNSCTSLSSVTFDANSNLQTIDEKCFASCTSLTEIVLPNSLVKIGPNLAYNCKNLKKLVLGANLTKVTGGGLVAVIGYDVKTLLPEIYMPASFATAEGSLESGNIFGRDNKGDLKQYVVYFTGTKEQALAFINKYSTDISLADANVVAYDPNKTTPTEYQGLTAYTTEKTINTNRVIVYGYNTCDAFYEGEHVQGAVETKFDGLAYASNLVKASTCNTCQKNFVVENICGPLFIELGYSKPNDNSSFGYGISVNQANIDKYIEATGDTLVYGFIIGLYSDKVADIISTKGESQISNSIVFEFSKPAYDNLDRFTLKFTSISDPSLELCCNMYVIANSEKVSYLGAIDNKTLKPVAVTVETIPTKED
ncbi:MAG: leucine-rich repeat domain-containing protein [Clostridia bacterium]|nr:leucine-rich repeat domain-containing protein [Clostridia bacterium]